MVFLFCFVTMSSERSQLGGYMSKFFATWDPQRISDFEAKLSDKDKPVFETAREFGVGIKQAWNFITNRDIKRVRQDERSDKSKPYDVRLVDLIASGELARKGISKILDILKSEMPDKLKGLTQAQLKKRAKELIWTDNLVVLLTSSIRDGLTPEKFAEYNPNIPISFVRERAKLISGVTISKHPVMFVPGMGRLDIRGMSAKDEAYELPATSINNPFEISVADGIESPSISILNGANLGIAYSRVIKDNVPRRALADARKNGDVAVILVNTIDVSTTKASAGPNFIRRAVISGINTSLAVLDPSYRPQAKDIIQSMPRDSVVYETIAEIYANVMDGWVKVSHRPNGEPEFDGPVFVVLGKKEADLIDSAAYQEIRYLTLVKQDKIMAEKKIAERAFISEKRKAKPSVKTLKALAKKIAELRREYQRTIVTNVRPEDRNRFAKIITAMVVKKFEESIPNCKVIGKNNTFIKFRNQVIEIVVPGHGRVTDMLLSSFVGAHGPKLLRKQLAPTSVVCHPYATNYRFTARQVSGRTNSNTVQMMVAPIAVDDDFLRGRLRNTVSSAHPIQNAIFDPQFKSGVLRLRLINGLIDPDVTSVGALDPDIKLAKGSAPAINKIPYLNTRYIWVETATDPHWGSRSKVYLWDNDRKIHLGVAEAAANMMREAGLFNGRMPIHMLTVNDDFTQGNHYETQFQPDPHEQDYLMIHKKWEKALADARARADIKEVLKIMEEMQKFTLSQYQIRGIDYPENQILAVFKRQIEPNIDFYDALLRRAKNSGILVKGVSQFQDDITYDSRDVAIINFGTGNHFARTVEKRLTEGFIFADKLRTMLLQNSFWMTNHEFVERYVRSPLYSNEYFAWGTVQAPGNGYEYGLAFSSTPPRMGSWNDPLLGAVRNDKQRGDYSNIATGRVTLKIYGDKHFLAQVNTADTIYHMGGAGTHTDQYGENGFAPNNAGVSFVGLPAFGPDKGPILTRTIRLDHLNKYYGEVRKFDWDSFLPNPV